MRTVRILLIFTLAFTFISCEKIGSGKKIRVGMDPALYPMNFMGKESYIDGFVDELFLEIAKASGANFEMIPANWDSVKDKLWDDQYDAIVSLMPELGHTLQFYDFSEEILLVGPILIVPVKSKYSNLGKMKNKRIGYIAGEDSILILEKYPDIISQSYNSITDLLNAVAKDEIDGALAEVIVASSYVRDLYKDKLKLVGDPLTDEALRLVAIKGENEQLISFFNKYLSKLKRSNKYKTLLRKWSLAP